MDADVDLDSATAALRRGDLLMAHDLAAAALAQVPGDRAYVYIRILALARMGNSLTALEQYRASALGASADIGHRSLLGRLLKDVAARSRGETRSAAFAAASEAYGSVYDETNDPFPGINAATCALLAGNRKEAEAIARRLLAEPSLAKTAGYFAVATKAEALLLVGDLPAAAAALREALDLQEDDGARSTTLRQLRLLLAAQEDTSVEGEEVLDMLRPAPVLTYCGHMFRHDPQVEARLSALIDEALEELGSKTAYGSLACGSDILIAEAILRRGGELNVVLPFEDEAFIERSIRPGGEPWLARFERCRDTASTVTYASISEYVGDRGQFRYGLLLAMGLARLRADPLDTHAVQLAVWNGEGTKTDAGTSAEVRYWQAGGGETRIIVPGTIDRRCGQRSLNRDEGQPQRSLRAIVFADFAGFSRLREAALPVFCSEILGRVAEVLAPHEAGICARNTWGDGVFVILRDVADAASVAAELQRALASFDYSILGDERFGMRISAHFGPVYEAKDPVTGSWTVFGREVTCAARIEPVTPVGDIYVTQPFAAMLAMEAPQSFDLCYVGRIDLAKGYGTMPMYRLEHAG